MLASFLNAKIKMRRMLIKAYNTVKPSLYRGHLSWFFKIYAMLCAPVRVVNKMQYIDSLALV